MESVIRTVEKGKVTVVSGGRPAVSNNMTVAK